MFTRRNALLTVLLLPVLGLNQENDTATKKAAKRDRRERAKDATATDKMAAPRARKRDETDPDLTISTPEKDPDQPRSDPPAKRRKRSQAEQSSTHS